MEEVGRTGHDSSVTRLSHRDVSSSSMASSLESTVLWELATFQTCCFMLGLFAILFAVVFGMVIVMWESEGAAPEPFGKTKVRTPVFIRNCSPQLGPFPHFPSHLLLPPSSNSRPPFSLPPLRGGEESSHLPSFPPCPLILFLPHFSPLPLPHYRFPALSPLLLLPFPLPNSLSSSFCLV